MDTLRSRSSRQRFVEIEEVQDYVPPAPHEPPYRGLFPLILFFLVTGLIVTFFGWHWTERQQRQARGEEGREAVATLLQEARIATPAAVPALVQRYHESRKLAAAEELEAEDRAFIERESARVEAVLVQRVLEHLSAPEYLEPGEQVSLALHLRRFLDDPEGEARRAVDIAEAELRIAEVIRLATNRVLELGRAEAGLRELGQARGLLAVLVDLVPAAERLEYRQAAESLEARIAQMEASIVALASGAEEEGGRTEGEARRHLYAERTLQALQRTGLPVRGMGAEGPAGRHLRLIAALPSRELSAMMVGGTDLRAQLVSLGFRRIIAEGTEGEVTVEISGQELEALEEEKKETAADSSFLAKPFGIRGLRY